mgnify:CR=1 FL=1
MYIQSRTDLLIRNNEPNKSTYIVELQHPESICISFPVPGVGSGVKQIVGSTFHERFAETTIYYC